MSTAERTDSPVLQNLPNSHYEHFGRVMASGRRDVPIGLVPLEVVFDLGIVTFNNGDLIHDVGAGSGRSFEFIVKKIPNEVLSTVHIVLSEPEEASRHMMGDRLVPISTPVVKIVDADGVTAIRQITNCDKIFLINAIHLFGVGEREAAIKAAYDSLNYGGQFIITSSFTAESDTEFRQFIVPWMRKLEKFMTPEETEVVQVGRKSEGATVMKRWKSQDYLEALTSAGFQIDFADPRVVMPVTGDGYEGISHYSGWNDNLIPGLERDRQVEIMVNAFREVWYEDLKREPETVSARNTLVVVARKPLSLAI